LNQTTGTTTTGVTCTTTTATGNNEKIDNRNVCWLGPRVRDASCLEGHKTKTTRGRH
jgi:hypothetical protein